MARRGPRGNRGPKGDKGDPGASQALYLYTATTGLSGYPGDGAIGWNDSGQVGATTIRVSHLTTNGQDIDIILANALKEGASIAIQAEGASENVQSWTITAPPIHQNAGTATAYFECQVSLVAGTFQFANSAPLGLVLVSSGIPFSNDFPAPIGTHTPGTNDTVSRGDHAHEHGEQTDETHHALAVADVSHGFLSKTWAALLAFATHVATALTLVLRDADGRFRAAAPSNSGDVTNKGYVDALISALTALASGSLLGTPYTASTNLSWSIATKTAITTLSFTTGSSGRVRLSFRGNVGVTNNGWGDLGLEVVSVAGSERRASVHGHTNGPRMLFAIESDQLLSPNTTYTLSLFAFPATGTISAGVISNPGVQWMEASVREGK